MKPRKIELLAPARNLECGRAAVDHGADAVYIGAPRFGARAAAGNTLEDIAALVDYAHLFRVRIYVTVNTILRDEELAETQEMILGALPHRGGCPHRAGHGYPEARPSAHSAPCEHTDGQPDAREGPLPG